MAYASMAMSCVEEASVKARSTSHNMRVGCDASKSGTAIITEAMAAQQSVTQVRRSPKRSMSGDQRTLTVHGSVRKNMKPMSLRETPFCRK